MRINRTGIHTTVRTREMENTFARMRRVKNNFLIAFVFMACLVLSGCTATAVPTIIATATASPTIQLQPSATFTVRPSPTASSTIVPTVIPSATPTQPAPTPEPVYYIVKPGDYAESIAADFGISVNELITANGLAVDDILSVGQKLLIPTPPVPTSAPDNTGQTSSPTPTPALVRTSIIHIVEQGENIDSIAAHYGITWEEIAQANSISQDSILSIGQELTIFIMVAATEITATPAVTSEVTPEPTQAADLATSTPAQVTYIVKSGDYIELIADHYGITVEQLADANGITKDAVLQVGQELVIPSQNAVPEATGTPTLTATPTATITPTAVKRVLPTVRPTTVDIKAYLYQQPLLLAPVNNSTFEEADATILLNWISVGILASGEWYQVRIWKTDAQDTPLIYYTKATSWRPPVGFYSRDSAPYTIRWQVVVVGSVMPDSTFIVQSPVSAVNTLYWR